MQADELAMLSHLWFPVARVQDVNPGKPLAGELLDRRVVIFRGVTGVAVAVDRCPHRGGRLSLGRMEGSALECPYHGWRWDEAGRCALVPSQPELRSTATLELLPSAERFGLVWASLGESRHDLPSIPEMEQDPGGGWELELGEWFDAGCGLRSITENFRDSSHFAFVHREVFGDVNPAIPAYSVRTEGFRLSWEIPLTFGASWAVRTDDDGPKYRFGANSGNGSTPGTEGILLQYRFELPALAYVYTEHGFGSKRLVCQVAAPLDVQSTRCRVFFLVAANAAFRQHEGSLSSQVQLEARIFSEDVPIVGTLDPKEAPLDLEGQAHVRADRYSVAYRKLYREILKRNTPSPTLPTRGREKSPSPSLPTRVSETSGLQE
jgi:phenylpropionate dioxygenase-like ring-hydroxylating dioxygenase large terminal subunit